MPELHAFIEVARLGSISAAAQALCVTQGGISRTVQRLETRLGATLFVRSAKGIRLTAAGQQFLEKVLPALSLLQEAVVGTSRQLPRREQLRVSIAPTFAMRWLIPRLPQFQARLASLRIVLRPYVIDDDFLRPDVDGWIQARTSANSPWPAHIRASYLIGREIVPICHPSVMASIKAPADLLRYPLLHHVNYPENWKDWFSGAGVAAPTELGSGFDLTAGLIDAVAANFGVAAVPRCVIEQDLRAGRVAMPLAQEVSTGRGYFFCVPRALENDSTLEAFRLWLEECALEDASRRRNASDAP